MNFYDGHRLPWEALPNRFDGSKSAELITSPNGVQRYAVWCTVLAIASWGPLAERGYLRRTDGSPHTPTSLSLIMRIPAPIYEDALSALIQLGWLEEVTAPGQKQGLVQDRDYEEAI
jgi:hypothetical protein